MRASLYAVILIAIAAGVWYWPHERPPVAARHTPSAPAPESRPDTPAHRGGAARSVRGALADGGAGHNDASRNALLREEPADAAPERSSVEAPLATPDAAPARASTAGIAPIPAAAAADTDPRAAVEAPSNQPADRSAPKNAPATPPPRSAAAPGAASAPAPAPAPKPAADLFAPFVGDDPSQVFAPASATYHAAVQGETVDPDWGPAAADALRGYITGLFGDRFEITMADCRQDLCELQIANRLGGDSAADIRDLTAAMGRLTQQPWWDALGFDQQSGITSYVPDGRVIALWFFSRR